MYNLIRKDLYMAKLNDQLYVNQKLPKSIDDLLSQVINVFANTSSKNFDDSIQSVFASIGTYFKINWVNLYQYDVNVRVAVIASSEEEAAVLIEQGRAQHISGDRTLASVTEIVI